MSVHNVNFVEYFSDQKGEKAKWPWSINKHPQKETLNLKNSMSDAEGRKLDIKFVLLLLSKLRQIWSVCCFNQKVQQAFPSTADLHQTHLRSFSAQPISSMQEGLLDVLQF